MAVVTDMTERKRAEWTARAFARIGHELVETLDPTKVTDRIVTTVLERFRAVRVNLYRLDPRSRALLCVATAGEAGPDAWLGTALLPGESLTARAVEEGRSGWSPDVLADPRVMEPAWVHQGLREEGCGPVAAVPLLAARVRDASQPASSRNRAARALAGIPSPACVAAALETLDAVPPGLQYQLVKSLSKLRKRDESLAFPPPAVRAALRQAARGYWELVQALALLPPARGPGAQLLRRAVAEKRDQQLKRIFRFLALQHSPQDLYNAYLGYVSGDRAARASALELLENVLRRADRELVVPLLDAPTSAAVVAAGLPAFGAPLATGEAAIDRLLAGADPWLRACAVRALLDDPTPAQRDRVALLARDADPVVRETAAQVLDRRG